MFGVRGTSCVGTAAADAPPASEKVNPAAPNTGAAIVPRFRFEACFTPSIVASSITFKRCSESSGVILRFANVPCKAGWHTDAMAHTVPGFHVHERLVHQRILRR